MLVDIYDIIFPILMLLTLIIYLIYSRTIFEAEIKDSVAKEFEKWKEFESKKISNKQSHIEKIAGVIINKNDEIEIVLFDKKLESKVLNAKIKTKE